MAIRIIRNVPANKVDVIERMFRNSGATAVTREEEDDHEFTVTAVFPDIERLAALEDRIGGLPGNG